MKLKVDFDANVVGTSYHNVNFLGSKSQLTESFGEPLDFDDPRTKYEWDFVITDDNGEEHVATLYDYKMGDFDDDEIIKWHIGSRDMRTSFMLLDAINERV